MYPMNIYEIADRLMDVAIKLDDDEDKEILCNASCMLSNIETTILTECPAKVLMKVIYPLSEEI